MGLRGEGRPVFPSSVVVIPGGWTRKKGRVIVVEDDGLVIGFIAVIGGLSLGTTAVISHFRHERRKRELEHIERIRALELGRTLPQDEPWLSPTKVGAFLATIVPIGVFVPAWLTTWFARYDENIWIAAAMVGLAAVICGSILVASSHKKSARSSETATAKPILEEDAYDVVSSRG
jgi:hypothetical protein